MNMELDEGKSAAARLTDTWKQKYLPLLIIFLLGAGLGAWAMHSWYVSGLREALASTKERLNYTEQLLYTEKQKPPVVKTETKTVTELAYVPKETIIYKDAETGQETASLEKTDIDMQVQAPIVYMKYNGQNVELQGISGETSKFEKGKLIGEISTAATVDVTDLVNKEVALQRESDKQIVAAKLNEIAARKYRPQVDLIGGAGTIGAGVRVNRVGADYLKMSDDEKILLRYTIWK
ncbi:hypothetical protein KL86SPO_60068 [uncultured Sporomusa sp.]|uniref:Uncharacterized protein n=1 Tax=uncultured Sporomusa sp. TaxID=307249 RepID=A0A212LZS8_9FIRM|nr:hypothetical protein [uncultured Sporomusa sp.]SCM83105.1 hypothetical protein KL86SPO_60068 [uncultured Sporomusa sp.]